MDKKKLIMGGVAVILIAGGVFLFTGKSSKGGIKLETAKVCLLYTSDAADE